MAPAPTVTYNSICRTLSVGDYRPVYLIHGEEGYYIDKLIKLFEEIIPAADRDFGLFTFYATQDDPGRIIDTCRQLPMMIERQVVIVKECQAARADQIDKLVRYIKSPQPSTILVISGRGDKVKGKEIVKAVNAAGGIVFESVKPRDWQMPQLVSEYIRTKGLSAEPKALEMLIEYIGTDLSRMYNEIDKLADILGVRAMITPEAIERNIGISKEYNNFELIDAIANKDVGKMMRIAHYFQSNPKKNPVTVTAAMMFNFFADLLTAYYAGDRSEKAIRNELSIRNDFTWRRISLGMSKYNAFQIIDILSAIRIFDRQSKGGDSRQDPYNLLNDLIYRIATTPGIGRV